MALINRQALTCLTSLGYMWRTNDDMTALNWLETERGWVWGRQRNLTTLRPEYWCAVGTYPDGVLAAETPSELIIMVAAAVAATKVGL